MTIVVKVEDVMSSPVWAVRPEDSLMHARNEMISRGVKKLPVVDDEGRCVGIVSMWDLAFSAGEEIDTARARKTNVPLDGLVKDAMTADPFVVEPGQDLRRVIREFVNRNIQSAPVVQNGVLQGILTESDILRGMIDAMPQTFVVGDIMSPDLVTVHRHTSLPKVLSAIQENRVHQLPVEESAGVLVGMVSLSNIVFGHWLNPRQRIEKRITTVHKGDHAGRKDSRHVEEVYAVVEDVMTQGVVTADVRQGVKTVANILLHEGFNALPVVEEGKPVGIITRRDILRSLSDQPPQSEVHGHHLYEGHKPHPM